MAEHEKMDELVREMGVDREKLEQLGLSEADLAMVAGGAGAIAGEETVNSTTITSTTIIT